MHSLRLSYRERQAMFFAFVDPPLYWFISYHFTYLRRILIYYGHCMATTASGCFDCVKWGICEEKMRDFRLNGGFAKRKCVIFA